LNPITSNLVLITINGFASTDYIAFAPEPATN
jgi:hypothetical protein